MNDTVNIQAELDKIMSRLHQDTFGGRAAPTVQLKENTGAGDDGVLTGGLEIHILRRDGEKHLLHEQSLDGISSLRALQDAFSEALSIVLSNHRSWPR